MKSISHVFIFSTIILMLIPIPARVTTNYEHHIDLKKQIPLKMRYPVGEILHYRLIRHSDFFRVSGTKFGEHKAVAYFTRTRIENDSGGRTREKFTWKKFAFGESFNPNEPQKLSYLKEADGFSLTCSVEDEDLITKLDFSSLPRTLLGMWFMIMSWDAVTFDSAVRPQNYYDFPDSALIGSEFRNTRGSYDFHFKYLPFMADSKYTFSGKNHSKIIGVSIEKGTPCAIIEFSNSENMINIKIDLNTTQMASRSLEHFWGKTYISLKDGRILKGDLIAPVSQVQDMFIRGQDEHQHLEYFVLQRLELELLSADKFEQEISEE